MSHKFNIEAENMLMNEIRFIILWKSMEVYSFKEYIPHYFRKHEALLHNFILFFKKRNSQGSFGFAASTQF